jgi:hypothetical protein
MYLSHLRTILSYFWLNITRCAKLRRGISNEKRHIILFKSLTCTKQNALMKSNLMIAPQYRLQRAKPYIAHQRSPYLSLVCPFQLIFTTQMIPATMYESKFRLYPAFMPRPRPRRIPKHLHDIPYIPSPPSDRF